MSKSPIAKPRPSSSDPSNSSLEPSSGVAQPPSAVEPVAPSAMVPPAPANMAAPVPRVRGSGPVCPIADCGSGMVISKRDRTNHPFMVRVYYKCLNPRCEGTRRLEERK